MLEVGADVAFVIGGYNSSNSTHLVELCEKKLKTYFINAEEKIISPNEILHFNIHTAQEELTKHYLPNTKPLRILITSGASCPDALVEDVIRKIIGYYPTSKSIESMMEQFI